VGAYGAGLQMQQLGGFGGTPPPPAGATYTPSGTQMIDPYYANMPASQPQTLQSFFSNP